MYTVWMQVNGVRLDRNVLKLGPWLTMNGKAERFLDNDQANTMLTRKYRKGFVVPDLGTA